MLLKQKNSITFAHLLEEFKLFNGINMNRINHLKLGQGIGNSILL